jgi:N-acetylneuraminic acid mutarotase
MFGGGNFHQFFNDLFSFDIESKTWQLVQGVAGQEPPGPRAGHTATKIDDSHFCVIGGGQERTVFSDIYLFNVDKISWIRVNTALH